MRHLGITLYTPATHPDLSTIAAGKFPGLTHHVWCTEDALREDEVAAGIQNVLRHLERAADFRCAVYLRVRSPLVLAQLARHELPGMRGFILPKIHDGNLQDYMHLVPADKAVQLTLETREALSEEHMTRLRGQLLSGAWAEQIEGLRIGGNDLMNALGLRRVPGRTLYEGPLERAVSLLVSVFRPYGFLLSSPVYEVFSDPLTLAREVQQDLEYGMSGKTIIHPVQLPTVIQAYRVSEADLAEARAILDPAAPAVFKMNGRMCEPATHSRWAQDILDRAAQYGQTPPAQGETYHYSAAAAR